LSLSSLFPSKKSKKQFFFSRPAAAEHLTGALSTEALFVCHSERHVQILAQNELLRSADLIGGKKFQTPGAKIFVT